jgi:flagellar motor protein MotB
VDHDDELDFNFWPSFADLMLGLVLILLIVLFVIAAVRALNTINLEHVKLRQLRVLKSIAKSYNQSAVILNSNREENTQEFCIPLNGPNSCEIRIANEPTLQRITFSDQILFVPDDYHINPQGQEVLKNVSQALKQEISAISQIQIQGHADTDPTAKFPSNVHLAAWRAVEVFRYLQNQAGINPAEHLMSATSFGEYDPVSRRQQSSSYSEEMLREQNASPELKAKNRRIEMLLFY